MTGPEHYKAAEEAIEKALAPDLDLVRAQIHVQLAQAHATLAAAAASALTGARINGTNWPYVNDDLDAWHNAVGARKTGKAN